MDTHAENGGTACTGLSSEQQDCSTDACPAGNYTILVILRQFNSNYNTYKIVDKTKFVYLQCLVDCVWGAWGTWADCSVTSGRGNQVRSRNIVTHAANGGTECADGPTELQSCNSDACPVGMTLDKKWTCYNEYI